MSSVVWPDTEPQAPPVRGCDLKSTPHSLLVLRCFFSGFQNGRSEPPNGSRLNLCPPTDWSGADPGRPQARPATFGQMGTHRGGSCLARAKPGCLPARPWSRLFSGERIPRLHIQVLAWSSEKKTSVIQRPSLDFRKHVTCSSRDKAQPACYQHHKPVFFLSSLPPFSLSAFPASLPFLPPSLLLSFFLFLEKITILKKNH